MKDMGMTHDGMDHGEDSAGMDHGSMGHGNTDHSAMGHGMDHSGMNGDMNHSATGHAGHAAMGHGERGDGGMAASGGIQAHDHKKGPGVANVAEMPVSRLHEPGVGLEDVPHRALVYADLKSLTPNPDRRQPGREIEIHLTGNMERFMWSFDGVRFSEIVEPIVFRKDERVRLTLVNDTMMTHPIHLHGMFFDVVTGEHHHRPRKHTINVKPGEKLSVDVTADAPGDWAFHCHLLYHMAAGMMQVVSVREHVAGLE
jgi:FtsP/CotA-like multicopper oxidase with cupredoxin domain